MNKCLRRSFCLLHTWAQYCHHLHEDVHWIHGFIPSLILQHNMLGIWRQIKQRPCLPGAQIPLQSTAKQCQSVWIDTCVGLIHCKETCYSFKTTWSSPACDKCYLVAGNAVEIWKWFYHQPFHSLGDFGWQDHQASFLNNPYLKLKTWMSFHLKEMMNPFPKTEIIVSNFRRWTSKGFILTSFSSVWWRWKVYIGLTSPHGNSLSPRLP